MAETQECCPKPKRSKPETQLIRYPKRLKFIWTIVSLIAILILCNLVTILASLLTNQHQIPALEVNHSLRYNKNHLHHSEISHLSSDYLDDTEPSRNDQDLSDHHSQANDGSHMVNHNTDRHHATKSSQATSNDHEQNEHNNHEQHLDGSTINHGDDGLEMHHLDYSNPEDNDQTEFGQMENDKWAAGQPEKEFLTSSLAEQTCQLDRGCQRKDRLNNTYLAYCTRHRLEWLFSTDVIDNIMHGSSKVCYRVLDEFIRLDEQINKFHESFITLLQRYNCHNGYSVKWTCNDCKRAYKDWLCTTNLPYHMNGERVKPCISFCERVEQRCPYLHPITKEQYGGQPAFICKDPNIPFVPEITPDTLHSKPGKCYDLCHLSNDKRELELDSLSTYVGRCPASNMIAEQVRDEKIDCQATNNNDTNLDVDTTASNGRSNLLPCLQPITTSQVPETNHHLYAPRNQTEHDGNNHLGPFPLHCEKLHELSIIFDSYKQQPKGQRFNHHDH